MKTFKIHPVRLCLLLILSGWIAAFGSGYIFMDEAIETWKPIKGYEDHYEVSDQGRIRSKGRYRPFKLGSSTLRYHKSIIKKQTPHYKNKYLSVLLKVDQIEKRLFVHRLVATHFIPNPENKPEVNHIFGNKNDNRACVLEWMTQLENTRHSIATGLTKHRQPIIAIKETSIIEFESKKKAGEYLNVCNSWVGQAVKRGFEINGFKFYSL